MYGLPNDFKTDFLIGRNLEQICINETQVYFHFNDKLFITVEGAFVYQSAEPDANEVFVKVPGFNVKVMELLGSSVIQASCTTEGTLNLVFPGGQTLKILDISDSYESYMIDHDGVSIIV